MRVRVSALEGHGVGARVVQLLAPEEHAERRRAAVTRGVGPRVVLVEQRSRARALLELGACRLLHGHVGRGRVVERGAEVLEVETVVLVRLLRVLRADPVRLEPVSAREEVARLHVLEARRADDLLELLERHVRLPLVLEDERLADRAIDLCAPRRPVLAVEGADEAESARGPVGDRVAGPGRRGEGEDQDSLSHGGHP